MYFFAQCKQCQHIGKDHDSVNQIRESPDQIHGKHRADINHNDIAQMIGYNPCLPEQIFHGAFPVIAPAYEGGNGEGHQRQGQKRRAAEGKEGKGCGGKAGGAKAPDGGRVFLDVGDDNQPCDGAHNHGIPENCRHGNQALPPGIPGFGGSGGNSRGADAGFIGEQSPGYTEAGGALQCASDKTACGCLCPEGAAYNQRYPGEQEIPVQDKQIQTAGNVEEAECRDHAGAEFTDGFDAAQDDQAGGKGCQDTDEMWRNRGNGIHRLRDGGGLCGAAHPKCGEEGAGSVNDSQPAAVQSVFQDIHGAAHIGFVRLLLFKKYTEVAFRIAGGHAKNTGYPAPEQRPGAADGDSGGDAHNIPGPKRRRQCCGKRRKAGQIGALYFLFRSDGQTYGLQGKFLGKFQFRGKVQMGGGKEYENGKTPQQLIDVFQNGKHTGLTVFSILYAAGDRDMYVCMPGGREAARPETPPENGRAILQKEKGETGKSRQKNKVQPGEKGKITSFFTSGRLGILFIGNQAGQRSDKGAQPSDIHAYKQGQIVFRKAGEQDGGRNIADALAGKNGHRKLMSGKHCAQKPDNHRQTPHVSDEDKEKYKGCKQSVIGFTYQFTVGKKQYNNNYGKNCLPAYYMKHAAKTQEKQQRICEQGPPLHRLGIRENLLHINLFTLLEEEEKKKQQRGKQRIGKHDSQKTGKAHAGKAVKIKILRVSDGGKHAAQVGGNGLQYDNKNHQLFLPCNRKNQYGKRDKGDQ